MRIRVDPAADALSALSTRLSSIFYRRQDSVLHSLPSVEPMLLRTKHLIHSLIVNCFPCVAPATDSLAPVSQPRILMNSNVVYGAPVCGHSGTVDYSQNCYPHHELSYYNHSAAELSSSHSSQAVAASTGSASGYGPSALHMSHPASQFLDPGISDANGLSYTNLDSNGYPTTHSKLGHFSPNENQRQLSGMSSAVISSAAASHQNYSSHHNSQYRDFSPDSVPSSHPDPLSDCAVMRSGVPGSVQSASQYPYLEPTLLSRRNGNLSYGDPSAFDLSCSQLNGSPYHLNHHLASHLHVSQHHHHPNGRTGGNSVTAVNPVPTYKWMQVKRNVPKPGKYCRSRVSHNQRPSLV